MLAIIGNLLKTKDGKKLKETQFKKPKQKKKSESK